MSRTAFQRFMDSEVRSEDRHLRREMKRIRAMYRELYNEIAECIRGLYDAYRASGSKESIYDWALAEGEYNHLIDTVEYIYRDRTERIEESIVLILMAVLSSTYSHMTYAYEWIDGIPEQMQALPDSLVDLTIEGGQGAWTTYSADPGARTFGDASLWIPKRRRLSEIVAADRDRELTDLTSKVTSSLATGSGIRNTLKTVRRTISMVTRTTKPDGTTVTKVHGAAADATRVMRTEGNRLINVGIMASAVGFYGLGTPKVRKEWVAILDTRTRQQSYEMDGQLVPLDGYFVYPNGATSQYPGQSGYPQYDINDRCTSMVVLVSDEGQTVGFDPFFNDGDGVESAFSWESYPDWEANPLYH